MATPPSRDGRRLGVGNLRHGMSLSGTSRLIFSRTSGPDLTRAGVDRSAEERIGHRRSAVAAFAKRSSTAQHQQTAAATIDEVGDHLKLIT